MIANAVVDEITLPWLVEQDACEKQRLRFYEVFGARAALTRANLARAVAEDFDLEWLAEHLLAAPALQAYEAATAPARQAYRAAKVVILADLLGLPEEEAFVGVA